METTYGLQCSAELCGFMFPEKKVHLWFMSFVFLSWAWGGVVVKSGHKDTEVNQNHWQPSLLNLAQQNRITHPMLNQYSQYYSHYNFSHQSHHQQNKILPARMIETQQQNQPFRSLPFPHSQPFFVKGTLLA